MSTKKPSLSYSLNAKSFKSYHTSLISTHDCGAIVRWSLFIQPCSHRLPTTKKVVDECKVIKIVNRCSRKNFPGLELFDREKVFCVVMELYSSNWFFFKLSRYAITTSLRADYCLSNREPFFPCLQALI